MPFKGSVIAQVVEVIGSSVDAIKRIVLDGDGANGAEIRFYYEFTGVPSPDEPSGVISGASGGLNLRGGAGVAFSDPIISVGSTGISASTYDGEDILLTAGGGLPGGRIELSATDALTMFADSFAINGEEQLTRQTYVQVPASSVGGPITPGTGSWAGSYVRTGDNIRGTYRVNSTNVWTVGAGTLLLPLPVLPDGAYINQCVGSGALFYQGVWYDGSVVVIPTVDGAYARVIFNNVIQPPGLLAWAGTDLSISFDYLAA